MYTSKLVKEEKSNKGVKKNNCSSLQKRPSGVSITHKTHTQSKRFLKVWELGKK